VVRRQIVTMLVFLLTLGSSLATSRASAQGSRGGADTGRAESAEYKRLIKYGLQEFELGNYPEARVAFSQAHEIFPNARTHRVLGLVAFELRGYRECIEQLSLALSSKEKPLAGTLRKSTEEILERALTLVGHVHFELAPASASVLIDGVSAELDGERRLTLEVGDHLVEVRAEGYLAERRALSVRGGDDLRVAVKLRPIEPLTTSDSAGEGVLKPQPAPLSSADRGSKRRWYKSPWLWTAVAVVAVGAGVGIGIALRPDDKTTVKASTGTENTPPGGVLRALRSW
jgi:hypothetical protein